MNEKKGRVGPTPLALARLALDEVIIQAADAGLAVPDALWSLSGSLRTIKSVEEATARLREQFAEQLASLPAPEAISEPESEPEPELEDAATRRMREREEAKAKKNARKRGERAAGFVRHAIARGEDVTEALGTYVDGLDESAREFALRKVANDLNKPEPKPEPEPEDLTAQIEAHVTAFWKDEIKWFGLIAQGSPWLRVRCENAVNVLLDVGIPVDEDEVRAMVNESIEALVDSANIDHWLRQHHVNTDVSREFAGTVTKVEKGKWLNWFVDGEQLFVPGLKTIAANPRNAYREQLDFMRAVAMRPWQRAFAYSSKFAHENTWFDRLADKMGVQVIPSRYERKETGCTLAAFEETIAEWRYHRGEINRIKMACAEVKEAYDQAQAELLKKEIDEQLAREEANRARELEEALAAPSMQKKPAEVKQAETAKKETARKTIVRQLADDQKKVISRL